MKYFFLIGVLFFSVLLTLSCSTHTCANERRFNSMKSNEKMTLNKGDLNMKKVKVAKSDGSLQCSQGEKISLDEMQKQLKDIHVFSATNQNDGMMRIQVCGSATGNHNVYEISETDLEKALSFGFKKWNK